MGKKFPFVRSSYNIAFEKTSFINLAVGLSPGLFLKQLSNVFLTYLIALLIPEFLELLGLPEDDIDLQDFRFYFNGSVLT